MATEIDIVEMEAKLSTLLDRVQQGEAFIVTKAGKPLARLVGIEPSSERPPSLQRPRRPGLLQGEVPESFFDPLPEAELQAWGSQRIPD